jgi:hypothetical protein
MDVPTCACTVRAISVPVAHSLAEENGMNIRQLRDLALKILGIYYLSSALVRAPRFANIFFEWNKSFEMAGHGLAISLSVLLPLVFWLFIGLLLTFRTALVAAILWPSRDEAETTAIARPSLRFWIVLIGFFFAVGAAGGAVAQLWVLVAHQSMRGSYMYSRFLPELVTLVLSTICIFKAQAIEAWLNRKIGQDSRPGVGQVLSESAPSTSSDEPST